VRKVVKRPDGTEEVIEGTAEEVAEYERQIKEGGRPAPKKKPVLHGAEVDGKPLTDEEVTLVRLHRLGLLPKEERKADRPVPTPMPWPVVMPDPYWLEPACGFCGQKGCRQMHIWYGTTSGIKIYPSEQVPRDRFFVTDGTLNLPTLSDVAAGAPLEVHFNEEIEEDRYSGMYPKH
jgi:hypothetical protein